jgi:hypothetical protein
VDKRQKKIIFFKTQIIVKNKLKYASSRFLEHDKGGLQQKRDLWSGKKCDTIYK